MPKFKPDNKKAKAGDKIEFLRNGDLHIAKVLSSNYKNSVVVHVISSNNWNELNAEFNKTVVAHKNYRVL